MTIVHEYRCPQCLAELSPDNLEVCSKCGARSIALNLQTEKSIDNKSKVEILPTSDGVDVDNPGWGLLWGFAMWFFSVLAIFSASIPAFIIWRSLHSHEKLSGKIRLEDHPDFVILALAFTFIAQLITTIAAYVMVVTTTKSSFAKVLGFYWHPRFRLLHTIGLTFLIFVIVGVLSSLLPNKRTDLEAILDSSANARYLTAFLAVAMAPLVEEVIYRGILYGSLVKRWGRWVAIIGVSAIFLGVHVPQYWGSAAVIVSLGALSFILTLVRAYTKTLLPCYVIHLLFNGVQAVAIVASTWKR